MKFATKPGTCPRCGTETVEVDGSSLRTARKAARRSLRSISDATSYSVPYLSDIERGNRRVTPAVLDAYLCVLGEGKA